MSAALAAAAAGYKGAPSRHIAATVARGAGNAEDGIKKNWIYNSVSFINWCFSWPVIVC